MQRTKHLNFAMLYMTSNLYLIVYACLQRDLALERTEPSKYSEVGGCPDGRVAAVPHFRVPLYGPEEIHGLTWKWKSE